jgi:Sulfate permease family
VPEHGCDDAVLVVGFSDDVLTARSFARGGETIRANRELLALGTANVGSGLVHGFPVSSSATRTAIAVAAGSRTQVYSLAAAVPVPEVPAKVLAGTIRQTSGLASPPLIRVLPPRCR